MKSSARSISLSSYDDIFKPHEQEEQREWVTQLPLDALYPFPDHPFSVRDDEDMIKTVESVKQYGVLVPAIVRPREEGGYEIVSGHRRKHACELAGLTSIPALIRDIDRDTATVMMVDSNLQREHILPSERAKAYKMKLEAIKRQAGRPPKEADISNKENCGQVGHNYRGVKSRDIVAEGTNESARTVQRFIRLTELQPELQQMVDEGKIAMTPAVELSYLKPQEQKLLLDTIGSEQATPSLSQAQRMKKLSQEGKLNDDSMLSIMAEQKKPESWNLTLPMDKIKRYFPRSYTPQKMEDTIIKLLEGWMRKRQRDQER